MTQIVDEVVALYKGRDVRGVAQRAGVSALTLYFWRNGKVRNPKADTLAKVAGAFGREIELRAGQPRLVGAEPEPPRRRANSAAWNWRWRTRR